MKRRIVVFSVLFALVIGTFDTTRAGFIDDWLAQKTTTSPGYFEGEKRGYVTGGSLSARWEMGNDHLFSVEAPRFKVGCGGIDLFMGGFSFLNADYLVQKFQKILQAAPAMAFDLALKTLCEPCSNVMKGLEALANGLNGLQMNDCHDSKVLAAKMVSPFTDDPSVQAEAQQSFSLQTGISDLYDTFQSSVNANNGQSPLSNDSGMFAGCPQALQDLFFNNSGSSVFAAIAAERGISQDHVALIRGFLGDMQIEPYTDASGNYTFQMTAVSPCPQNTTFGLDNFLDGSAYTRPIDASDAACAQATDTNANLTTWAHNAVYSVYNNLMTQGALSSDDQALINTVPLVYHNLVYAAATKQGPQVLFELADFTARAYALALIKDLYSQALYDIRLVQTAMKKQGTSPQPTCQVSAISLDVDQFISLDKRIQSALQTLQEDYQKYLTEHAALFAVGQHYNDFMNTARDKLSQNYSKTFVDRVMSRM